MVLGSVGVVGVGAVVVVVANDCSNWSFRSFWARAV